MLDVQASTFPPPRSGWLLGQVLVAAGAGAAVVLLLGIFASVPAWLAVGLVLGLAAGTALTGLVGILDGPWRALMALGTATILPVLGLVWQFPSLERASDEPGAPRLLLRATGALLAACLVSLFLFLRRQLRARDPIYDLRLFLSNRVFALANGAVFLNFMATYGSQYLLPLYLQCNRGLSPLEAGKITLFQPLMQVFFSPLAGWLASRIPPAQVASGGMGMIAAALILLSRLTETTPLAWVYGAMVLIGIGISLFSAPNTSIILESVPPERRGMAAASNSIMRNLGMQTSVILCGAAFLVALGQVKGIPPERYGDMLQATRVCYGLFAGICLVGMGLSLGRVRRGGVPGTEAPAEGE